MLMQANSAGPNGYCQVNNQNSISVEGYCELSASVFACFK